MKKKFFSIVLVGFFCLPFVLTQCKSKEETPPMRDTKEDYQEYRRDAFDEEFKEEEERRERREP